jgi:hypothetical protein
MYPANPFSFGLLGRILRSVPIALLLVLRSCLLLAVYGCLLIKKGRRIGGVEGIQLHRLLTCIGQGDVDAAVLRQVDYADLLQNPLLVRIAQVRILVNQIGHFILAELLRLAEGLNVDRGGWDTLRHQEVFCTVDAAF